jgi:hypothetical protein
MSIQRNPCVSSDDHRVTLDPIRCHGLAPEIARCYGDRGQQSRLIETVPRIGYRLAGEVRTEIDPGRSARNYSLVARLGLYALTAIIAALIALAVVHQHYDKFVDRPSRASSSR